MTAMAKERVVQLVATASVATGDCDWPSWEAIKKTKMAFLTMVTATMVAVRITVVDRNKAGESSAAPAE